MSKGEKPYEKPYFQPLNNQSLWDMLRSSTDKKQNINKAKKRNKK